MIKWGGRPLTSDLWLKVMKQNPIVYTLKQQHLVNVRVHTLQKNILVAHNILRPIKNHTLIFVIFV